MKRKEALTVLLFWMVYTSLMTLLVIGAIGFSVVSVAIGLTSALLLSLLMTALTVGSQTKDRDE